MVVELNKYRNYLIKVALDYTNNREDALDLVQDTYEKAMQSNYREKNIKAWLCTIMINHFINDYRKRKCQKNDKSNYKPNTIVYNLCYYEFLKQDVKEAVKKLTKNERLIFVLYVKGYKYYEIAEKLNKKTGTVKTEIHRIRKKLKYLLS